MKLNQVLKSFLIFALGIIVFTSCDPEGTGGGTGSEGPSITFGTGSGTDLTVMPQEVFTVRVNASEGNTTLKTVTVYDDGAAIDFSRLTVNSTAAAANPILLFGTDKNSFTYDLGITAHSDVSSKIYAVEVEDDNGAKKSVSITVTTESTPPTLLYENQATTFDAGTSQLVSLTMKAETGSGSLSTIAVYEEGVLIADATDLEVAGTDFDANPFTLPEALQTGFEGMIIFRSSAEPGTKVYKVVITDEFGNTAEQEVTLNLGTRVEAIMGALLNSAGPSGTGGVDLDNGMSTGSGDGEAELRDLGIDNSLPNAENWIQRVAGVDGATVKYIQAGMNGVSEDFMFSNISFTEQVVSLHDSGIDFTEMVGGSLASNVIQIGDILSVKDGDNYYLVEVENVTVTVDDNTDQYTINIKK